jgi:hypothetical protein
MPVRAQGSASLSVTGSLVDAHTFNADELKPLPQSEIADSRSIERDGIGQTRRIVYRGVLLRDVILAAGFKEKQRHDFRRTLFVATASDGYIGLFTWGELFNSESGNHVLVVLESDGKPLPASEGPFALRSLTDIRPGPRHIRWLQEIRVVQIEK